MCNQNDRLEKLQKDAFDAIKEAKTVKEAIFALRDGYDVGHVTYHLAQTVPGQMQIDAPFVRTTYPDDWVSQYLLNDYVRVDPVIKEGMLRALPFDWSEIEPDEAAVAMLQDFHTHKLGEFGYSIPISDKVGRRALLSLNSRWDEENWDELVSSYRMDWAELAHVLHKKAIFELFGDHDPASILSPRELDVLYWTAKGKDYKGIAIILEISDHTVRTYMRSARYKLNCTSLSQAVAKAIQLRLINP